jgi:hypothetical protein
VAGLAGGTVNAPEWFWLLLAILVLLGILYLVRRA